MIFLTTHTHFFIRRGVFQGSDHSEDIKTMGTAGIANNKKILFREIDAYTLLHVHKIIY